MVLGIRQTEEYYSDISIEQFETHAENIRVRQTQKYGADDQSKKAQLKVPHREK